VELKANGDLYHRAAYASAKFGRLEEAVVTLERGRARRLGEALAQDRADLEDVMALDEKTFLNFQRNSMRVRMLESADMGIEYTNSQNRVALRNELSKARKDFDETIAIIRSLPNHDKFLVEPEWEDISDVFKNGKAPLVYLVTTPVGSLALIIHTKGTIPSIESIWQDELKEKDLEDFYRKWSGEYKYLKSDYIRFFNAIEEITKNLWNALIGQVIGYLSDKEFSEAILIPTGFFALLPLHAAWTDEKGQRIYALDKVAFSFAPSARALNQAYIIAKKVATEQLLAVDNPLPISKRSPLRYSNQEVSFLESVFPSRQILSKKQATKEAVLQTLPNVQIAHFCCHGSADREEPLESGLLMSFDEKITVQDLFQLKLSGARMAVLSACETGIIGAEIPDEVISLPSAFMQAGFAGAVSSLWSVDDQSTAQLMECFYRLWRERNMSPAFALRQAQQWLRDNHEKRPFYWAAFYLTGV